MTILSRFTLNLSIKMIPPLLNQHHYDVQLLKPSVIALPMKGKTMKIEYKYLPLLTTTLKNSPPKKQLCHLGRKVPRKRKLAALTLIILPRSIIPRSTLAQKESKEGTNYRILSQMLLFSEKPAFHSVNPKILCQKRPICPLLIITAF